MDFFRLHDDSQQQNMGTLSNPTYEQIIIQSTLSNSNYKGRELIETPYSIPINVKSNTLTNTCTLEVNDTSGGVPSFIYQDNVQMEEVYSLADDQQTGDIQYNQLQKNWGSNESFEYFLIYSSFVQVLIQY